MTGEMFPIKSFSILQIPHLVESGCLMADKSLIRKSKIIFPNL